MNYKYYNPEEIEKRIITKSIGEDVCKNPFVSIVIPAYNVSKYIAETLDSALGQTFRDFEIIVVNDGSPDTEELEKVLTDYFPQIIYIKQTNGGAAAARNTAIHFARGKFTAFLDGDDVWYKEKLEKQTAFVNAHNLDITYCDALLFGEKPWDGKTFMETSPSQKEVAVESLLSFDCNVITSGTVCKTDKIIASGGFDENKVIAGAEDFDLWVRLLKNGCRADYQQEILLKYRIVVGSLSGGNVARANRTLNALLYVKEKNSFTGEAKKICDFGIERAKAQLELEKGKSCLVSKDFRQAETHFRNANVYHRKPKYSLAILLLKIKPELVLKIFKEKRGGEFSFIVSNSN